MLEICKRNASTKQGQVKIGIIASVFFIVFMVVGLLVIAQPYAVYADTGEKVSDPWEVKVDGETVAVVDSQEAAESVEAGVVMTYAGNFKAQQEATIDGDITVEKYDFDTAKQHPVVVTTEDAVDAIVNGKDENGDPLVLVTTTSVSTKDEAIKFSTQNIASEKLDEGDISIKTRGSNGLQTVTRSNTVVNGKVVKSTVLSSEVIKEPVTQVQLKGTKSTATATASSSSSSSSSSSVSAASGSNGSSVVSYATQFVGNPYVYGGTSLTGGCDCSGFTMAVYSQFGVSLPHSSYSQGSMGTTIPASQAQPGDLVCYGGHVGIYIGGGQMVHAANSSQGIIIGTVNYASHWFVRVL